MRGFGDPPPSESCRPDRPESDDRRAAILIRRYRILRDAGYAEALKAEKRLCELERDYPHLFPQDAEE